MPGARPTSTRLRQRRAGTRRSGKLMTKAFDEYRAPDAPIPHETWAWNMYGAGIESIGRSGKPERFPVPEPNDSQLLVRVDAVSLCFSDVKLIQQGSKHPKLYNRDLAIE